jgi:serine/threonine protein kinase
MSPTIACANCSEPIAAGARFCSRCGQDVSGPQGNLTTGQLPLQNEGARDPGLLTLEHLRRATLGEYDIAGELGRGGMAIVYLAHDIALDRKVAIKVMNPGLLMGVGMSDRFKREARTAASLTHPNIIPIHLVRETENLLFFVMKYVEGRGLDSVIAETGPLPIRMALTILAQVGGALGYAHRRGVVHRDVKPANILIDTEGWIVVTDFGIAKVAEAGSLTVSGMTVGTPRYMSPEQCTARPVSGASDQYSLGIVGYEMITGGPPFAADSLMEIMRMHFFEPPAPLLSLRPECPPALAAAIERMLAKEPEQRWPSVEDAISAAGQVLVERNDPVRGQMGDLAKTGIKQIARISAPVSPTPQGRSQPRSPSVPPAPPASAAGVPPTGLTSRAESPAHRQRRRPSALVLGIVGLAAVVVSLGVYLLARSAPTDRRPQPGPIPTLAIEPVSVDMQVGDSQTLTPTPKDSAGQFLGRDPVDWSSSAPSVASVSPGGVVVGLTPGSVEVSARSGGRSASSQVTVRLAAVQSIQVSPPSGSIPVRGTIKLEAVAQDARARPLPGRSITWSSGDPAIATVSEDGLVTGVNAGTVTLEARSEGIRGQATISVTARAAVPFPGPATGLLRVILSGSWAEISIDGKRWGRRNQLEVPVSAGARHTVHLERPGFISVDTSVAVQAGTPMVLRISLRRASALTVTPGFLRIQIRPSWAEVSIDRKNIGQRRDWGDSMGPGPHRLRFEREGYITVDTTVTLQPAETLQLRIDMQRRSP